MKKILTLLILGTFLLTGCSQKNNLSDGSEVIFSVNDESLTKEQLYISMLPNAGKIIYNDLSLTIIENQVPDTDELTKKAEETLVEEKKRLGDSFLEIIKSAGFSSEQDYYNRGILPSIKASELASNYLNANLDKLANTYNPLKIRLLEYNTSESAEDALSKLTSGSATFDELAELSTSIYYKGKEEIFTNVSSLSSSVISEISKIQETGIYHEVIVDSDKNTFYIVNVVDTDINNFQVELLETLKINSTVQTDAQKYYAKDGKFSIYDTYIKQLFESVASGYFD